MGLLVFLCGVGATLVGISGYLLRSVRKLDEILPDPDAMPTLDSMVLEAQLVSLLKMKAVKTEDVISQRI